MGIWQFLSTAFSTASKIAGEQAGITSRKHRLAAMAGALFLAAFMVTVIVVIALKVVGWLN